MNKKQIYLSPKADICELIVESGFDGSDELPAGLPSNPEEDPTEGVWG